MPSNDEFNERVASTFTFRTGVDLSAILDFVRSKNPGQTDNNLTKEAFRVIVSLEGLIALQLVSKTYWQEKSAEPQIPLLGEVEHTYMLTLRGRTFIEACTVPH